ncbi:ABC transporter ATP-binding protein [Ignisphaera sp. 4213-co]|uniref:ABC transporter ATP-binding protein n=1 Tax=Ignisphaera cupida TaxID=3050454 RepID=A0ABD4Z4X1_9CREN|nr:ABC transporter ATP-binding protein [Ignisphaera sp. 4213-co]MDK6028356.1 ABC transporter ATP-binding protein [Ignisphaera sp. 4213-co]
MKIVISGVEVWYNSVKALDEVSAEIESGEMVFVIGPNGAGKTTLLKTIASIVKPSKGVIYIDGKTLSEIPQREIGKIIAFVDPHISRSIPSTVFEFLLTARYPHQNTFSISQSPQDVEIIDSIAKQFNITHLLNRRLDQLSSGELQRVLIARAMVQQPKILLLDEPSAFLDLRHRLETLRYVKNVVKTNDITCLVAIHDIYLASLYADKVVIMSRGSIIAFGTPDEVLKKEILEKVYNVRIAYVDVNGRKVIIPIEPI